MPRSRPGPLMRVSSSEIAPSVGSIRPATRRSRLVLPQPEGPTMTENSLSSTSSEMFSSAVTGTPRRDVNRSATLSMRSFGDAATVTRPPRAAAGCAAA